MFPSPGPFTSPLGVEVNAWSRAEEGDPDWPDLQYLFMSLGPGLDYGLFLRDLIGYRRDVRFFACLCLCMNVCAEVRNFGKCVFFGWIKGIPCS